MKRSSLFFIVIILVLNLGHSQDCTTASQADCGATGSTCQYYLWNNGTCVAPATCPTSPTITVWSNSTSNCVACSSANSQVCGSCLIHKYYFNTRQNLCTTCGNTYGSLCTDCNSSQCITCASGFLLSSDLQSCFNGACNVEYCEICANSTACDTCDSIHRLFSGQCVCSIPNCEICSSGICQSCRTGYALDASKTKCNFICITNCDVCTDLNSCTNCALGYYYDSSVNQCRINCQAIDPNCLTCSSTIVCSSCTSSYTLGLSKTVCNLKCADSNCITCATTNNCTLCTTGFYKRLNSTTNLYYCSRDICQISYCTSCASARKCKTCTTLYKLSSDDTACIPDCNIDNCAYCASSVTCQTCNDGYKTASGSCTPICTISNCQLCDTSTTCKRCASGFVGSQNKQSCNYNCDIRGCINCDSATTCGQCYTGLTLSTSKTVCQVNCQDGFYRESSSNSCKACPASHCLTCNSIGKCLSCINLYYLDSDDFSCKACSTIANCFNCEAGNAVCTDCISGFALVNKVCVDQTTCAVTNCKICESGSTTLCKKCQTGYSVANSGASCEQIVCPGNQYLDGNTCTCGPKSNFVNGVCSACSDNNCITCVGSTCSECILGYYPSGSGCTKCSTNCKVCDSTGCTTCNENFIKSNGVCNPPSSTKTSSVARTGEVINCDTGCKVCDLDTATPPKAVCRSAEEGYVLVSGRIYKCSSTCLTCSSSPNLSTGLYSICLTCPKGTNYNAGSCSRCSDKNAITCRTANAAYSLTCKPGFNPEGGVCKACADNCLKCGTTKSGSCDAGGCATGFYQSKNFPTCVKCFNGCLVCDTDPNICLKCGDKKFLQDNVCYSCSDNCETCTSATACTACDLGYLVTSTGSCRSLSIDHCVAYDSNFLCTSCDKTYNLDASGLECILDTTCSGTKTCSSCKQGFYLSEGACLTCPSLSNCNTCNQYDSTQCTSCVDGFYSNLGACTQCPQTGCSTCISEFFCTAAQDGYYLAVDIMGAFTGDVLECGGLCTTCQYSAITCITCQSGATLVGTSCMSKSNYEIFVTASVNNLESGSSADYELGQAISLSARFLEELGVNAFKFPSFYNFQANSNIKSISKGSINIAMTVNQDSLSVDPNTALANTEFTDIKVLSQSIVTNNDSTSSVNLGLVLGVAIPLGVLLIAIIIILKIKSEKAEEESGLDGTEKDIEYQAEQF